jgi:hypothetical protein
MSLALRDNYPVAWSEISLRAALEQGSGLGPRFPKRRELMREIRGGWAQARRNDVGGTVLDGGAPEGAGQRAVTLGHHEGAHDDGDEPRRRGGDPVAVVLAR